MSQVKQTNTPTNTPTQNQFTNCELKQIAEIYELLTRDCDNSCSECKFSSLDLCLTHRISEEIYKAGYRKQSEGEWVKHTDEYDCEYATCSCCGEDYYDSTEDTIDMFYNFCPNCGAKMKGGEG